MLTAEEIERDLFDLPERFKGHMKQKEYALAKSCYDTALQVSLFVHLDPDLRTKLFGEREKEIEGMFREQDVQKAVYETCIKRKKEEEAVKRDHDRRYGLEALRKEFAH